MREVVTGIVKKIEYDGDCVYISLDEGYHGVPLTACRYTGRDREFISYLLKAGDYIKAGAVLRYNEFMHITGGLELPRLSKSELDTRVMEASSKLPVRYVIRVPSQRIVDGTSARFDRTFKMPGNFSKSTIRKLGL